MGGIACKLFGHNRQTVTDSIRSVIHEVDVAKKKIYDMQYMQELCLHFYNLPLNKYLCCVVQYNAAVLQNCINKCKSLIYSI